MDPMFQDSRISAYLDDEMSAEERSRFEDELARSAELRQVVDELRGLRESLQQLPRHRLGGDFAAQVLRRAERAMLTSSAPAESQANQAPAANGDGHADSIVVRGGGPGEVVSRFRRGRRPWIWAAAAVAVAVLLMVFTPRGKKHATDIAKNDVLVKPIPEGVISARHEPSAGSRSHAGDVAVQPLLPAPSGAFNNDSDKSKGSFDFNLRQNAGKLADSRRQLSTTPTVVDGPIAAGGSAVGAASTSPTSNIIATRAARPPARMLVAEYEATPQASQEVFKQLLVDHGIEIRPSVADKELLRDRFADEFDRGANQLNFRNGADAARPVLSDEKKAAPSDKLEMSGGLRSRREKYEPSKSKSRESKQSPVEVVYVVGSREQVEGLMADLQSRRADYRQLAIAPVDSPPADLQKRIVADAWKSDSSAEQLGRPPITGENSYADGDNVRERSKFAKEAPASKAGEQNFAAAPAAPPPVSMPAAPPALTAAPQNAAVAPQGAALPSQSPANSFAPLAPPAAESTPAIAPAQDGLKEQPSSSSTPSFGARGGGKLESGATGGLADRKGSQRNKTPPPDVQFRQNSANHPTSIQLSLDQGIAAKNATAKPTTQTHGLGWAVQITDLPAEAKDALRRSLLESENTPDAFDGQPTNAPNVSHALPQVSSLPKATEKSDKSSIELGRPKDKAAVRQIEQGNQAAGGRDNRTAGSEQVQAIFVFRLAPGTEKPAAENPANEPVGGKQ